MEEKEVMYFKDEEGNKIAFEAIAEIYLEEQKYLILSQVGDNVNEDDAFVFRVDKVNDNEELNLVEDNAEFDAVKKEYKKLLYNK